MHACPPLADDLVLPYSSTSLASPFPNRIRPQVSVPIDHLRRQVVRIESIDELPDEVLLGIFDFYVKVGPLDERKIRIEAWQLLVHVCRRWRNLVFQSPRRLNLRLFCSPETPARDTLDVWPALPLIVRGHITLSSTKNVISALGQSNRVCQVILSGRHLETALAPMRVSFPELTDLVLSSDSSLDKTLPVTVIPGDNFMGGSAPRLRILKLDSISFPGLPKLLHSATQLVELALYCIPYFEYKYISPRAIVALLSELSNLESLILEFECPGSLPDSESRSLLPPKRSILPALVKFHFEGIVEYLEQLVTRIDAPQLDHICITFLVQIDFYCPRLAQFINCTPAFRECDEVHMRFYDDTRAASVTLRYRTSTSSISDDLRINISCRGLDQLPSIEQVCTSSSHLLSTVEDLYLDDRRWKNDAIENDLWLELLLPFTAVKNFYMSERFAPGIAVALQELVGGRITEVLPSLENIFVKWLEPSGPFQENIGQFVAARQLSNNPIAIHAWNPFSKMDST